MSSKRFKRRVSCFSHEFNTLQKFKRNDTKCEEGLSLVIGMKKSSFLYEKLQKLIESLLFLLFLSRQRTQTTACARRNDHHTTTQHITHHHRSTSYTTTSNHAYPHCVLEVVALHKTSDCVIAWSDHCPLIPTHNMNNATTPHHVILLSVYHVDWCARKRHAKQMHTIMQYTLNTQ
jgi:hypothetical protein